MTINCIKTFMSVIISVRRPYKTQDTTARKEIIFARPSFIML